MFLTATLAKHVSKEKTKVIVSALKQLKVNTKVEQVNHASNGIISKVES